MLSVISVGSLKASGSATVALTLASVAAAADIPVVVIDAAGQGELGGWAAKAAHPPHLAYEQAGDIAAIERALRQARRRGAIAIIDAGEEETTVRAAAGFADRALIPVRFSPLSAYSALVTDQMLATDARRDRKAGDRCFVASAITAIGNGVACSIEAIIGTSDTLRLPVGLSQRAAHAAPFAHGGTIFTLDDTVVSGLDHARAEAASFAQAVGILGAAVETSPARRSEARRQAA